MVLECGGSGVAGGSVWAGVLVLYTESRFNTSSRSHPLTNCVERPPETVTRDIHFFRGRSIQSLSIVMILLFVSEVKAASRYHSIP